MRPTLFTIPLPLIGSVPVRGYGLMVALGFLAAIYIAVYRAKKAGMQSQTVFDLGLYILVSALLGARLFHALQHSDSYNSFLDVLKVWDGGLAYYGGFILALGVAALYIRQKKLSMGEVTDVLAPATMLGLGIGRIGCFLAGCCFGKPTSLPWGVTFPEHSIAWIETGAQKVHPTQIYSSINLLAIFAVLVILERYTRFPGQLFLLGVLMYSIHRFLIDFLRYYTPDERIGSLAISQVMSIVTGMLALVIMVFIMARRSLRVNPV